MDEDERMLAIIDVAVRSLFEQMESFPRFKDHVNDPLQAAADAGDALGALFMRGPPKMLQTVASLTAASKAQTAAERFKVLRTRCKWLPEPTLLQELAGCPGTEGLKKRLAEYNPAKQFVIVVVAELPSGELSCKHATGSAAPGNVPDVGPCEFVLDHGATRTQSRPGFNYNGSLKPYRVSPDVLVPAHIVKPDYHATGQPEAERASEARNTPVCAFPQRISAHGPFLPCARLAPELLLRPPLRHLPSPLDAPHLCRHPSTHCLRKSLARRDGSTPASAFASAAASAVASAFASYSAFAWLYPGSRCWSSLLI